MAEAYSCNQITPDNGADAMFQFKQALKAVGWTVPKSSDGTTAVAADIIATGSSGITGLANNNAWFVIKEPGGNRSYCVQRGTDNTVWRIKYGVDSPFTGSYTAAATPLGGDEVIRLGAGDDASPTFGTLFPTDASYRFQWGIHNTAPYSFHNFSFAIGGGAATQVFVHDAIQPGTYHVQDVDPFCQLIGYDAANMLKGAYMGVATSTAWNPAAPTVTGPTGWFKKGLTGSAYYYYYYSMYFSVQGGYEAPPSSDGYSPGPEPYTNTEIPAPIWVVINGAYTGRGQKGWSQLMKWVTSYTSRVTGDVLQAVQPDATTVYYILANQVWLPWTSLISPLQ